MDNAPLFSVSTPNERNQPLQFVLLLYYSTVGDVRSSLIVVELIDCINVVSVVSAAGGR